MTLRHSLRGSVDWNFNGCFQFLFSCRHSLRGSVDWNLSTSITSRNWLLSLPSRECGLKFWKPRYLYHHPMSLPSRECGLKLYVCTYYLPTISSLPSRECGLKSVMAYEKNQGALCHSLRGSVDWNHVAGVLADSKKKVTPFAGVWIEILKCMYIQIITYVTPFAGVWIEICCMRKL